MAVHEENQAVLRRAHTSAVWLLTIAGAVFFLMMAFLTERRWAGEERPLFNIPYTYLHEGRLAFPAYAWEYPASYDRMFVHPPTHYAEIAYLMKLGLPLYYAEAIPTALWAILCLIIIATARFASAVQLGLFAGVISGVGWVASVGFVDFGFHLRPDAHMAFALLAGFLLLAAAEVQGWEYKRLFAGSFLVTYGSTVHYPGWCAWTGVLIFLFMASRILPWREYRLRLLTAVVGASLAGIPYVVFHVLPNRGFLGQLSSFVSLAQIRETIRMHFVMYQGAAQFLGNWHLPYLLYAWPLKQAFALMIPPFVVSFVLLICHKQTRTLAVATLPFSLFLFAILARKLFSYLYLECMMAIIGTCLLITWAWTKASFRLPANLQRIASPLFAIFFLIAFWRWTPELRRVEWKYQQHEFGLLRAQAKEIMGPNATVASIHPLWYVSGGTRWFDLQHDLLGTPPADLRTYFSRFDAIAALSMLGYYGTSSGINEATLYERGILHLRGFMESRLDPDTRWVWIAARHDQPVRGFFWKDRTLFQFRESPQGHKAVASIVMSGDLQPFLSALAPLAYWALVLPKAAGETSTRYVLIMLLDEQHYNSGGAVLGKGNLLEVVHGDVEQTGARDWPLEAEERDSVANPRSYAELLSLMAKPSNAGLRTSLRLAACGNSGEVDALVHRQGWTRVAAQSVNSEALARADLPNLTEGRYYRISLDMEMDAGGLATYIVQDGKAAPVTSLYREVPLRNASERFVFQYTGDTPAHLLLSAYNISGKAPVRFDIREPVLEEVDSP